LSEAGSQDIQPSRFYSFICKLITRPALCIRFRKTRLSRSNAIQHANARQRASSSIHRRSECEMCRFDINIQV